MLIHICDYASQPDIRIFCTQTWTTPKWPIGDAETAVPGLYLADNGMYYSFDLQLANCKDCLNKAELNKEVFK